MLAAAICRSAADYANGNLDSSRLKKTVRIRTPEKQHQVEDVVEASHNLENWRQQQEQQPVEIKQVQQQSSLVEEDVFRRRQYRVGLNLFNQVRSSGHLRAIRDNIVFPFRILI